MPIHQKIFTIEITPQQFLNNCSPAELKEVDLLIQGAFYQNRMKASTCRICGCTDYDCSQCIERTGEVCYWFEPNLCSACASSVTQIKPIEND